MATLRGRLRFARSVAEGFGPEVARLLGLRNDRAMLRVGQLGGGHAAESNADTNVLTFDREFLLGTSRADLRGNIIHELAHIQGAGYGKEKAAETLADYARYKLNPHERPGWDPSKAVLKYDRNHGDNMAYDDIKPPTTGSTGGRRRNTLANMKSKQNVIGGGGGGSQALPALSPAETANYYQQLSGLYSEYQLGRQALKAQRVGMRQDFKAQRADIRSEMLTGLASTENANIERGVSGSSADLQERAGVRGAAASAIAQARGEMLSAKSASRLQSQQLAIGFQQGAAALEANKLATQQERLAQQLEQNQIISGQEAQLDAIKAMYESIMGQFNTGGAGGGGGNRTQPRGRYTRPGISYGGADDMKALQAMLAKLAKTGKGTPVWQTGGGF